MKMTREIKKTARLFARREGIGSLMSFTTLESKVVTNGWRLRPYSRATEFIKEHNLQENTKRRAFAYTHNGKVVILYRDDLPYILKLFVIYHEIGHIVLGHNVCCGVFGRSDDSFQNDVFEEEADTFAFTLIKYVHIDVKLIAVAVLAAACIIIPLLTSSPEMVNEVKYNQVIEPQGTQEMQQGQLDKVVYVTKSGLKYHREGCYTIKNSDTKRETSKKEAIAQGYKPCHICLPNDND